MEKLNSILVLHQAGYRITQNTLTHIYPINKDNPALILIHSRQYLYKIVSSSLQHSTITIELDAVHEIISRYLKYALQCLCYPSINHFTTEFTTQDSAVHYYQTSVVGGDIIMLVKAGGISIITPNLFSLWQRA